MRRTWLAVLHGLLAPIAEAGAMGDAPHTVATLEPIEVAAARHEIEVALGVGESIPTGPVALHERAVADEVHEDVRVVVMRGDPLADVPHHPLDVVRRR